MRYLCAFLLGVFLLSIPSPIPVQAEVARASCNELPAVEWREERTQAFTILYPAGSQELSRAFSAHFGEELDAEYSRFAALFETPLTLPISLRVYPTETHYYCLNTQAPEIQPGETHSQIGLREIALIRDNIAADLGLWLQNYQNFIRYELAVLFTRHITNEKALPGLLVAVGHYGQDPAGTIGKLHLSWTDWSRPAESWRRLWEDAGARRELGSQLEGTSTVAFLIDRYGWAPFLQFLQDLRTSESYSGSLSKAYRVEFSALQEEWQEYFPQYFRERWKAHILYNYDLSPYAAMLGEEKYTEAEGELEGVIAFLEKTGQVEKLVHAHALLQNAQLGQEADILVSQARQAIYTGDHARALELLDRARRIYSRIGNAYRLDELSGYRDQVQKILVLHTELDGLRTQVTALGNGALWNTFTLAGRLVSLGQRSIELGDFQGHSQVQEMAQMVEARRQAQQLSLSLAVITLVLALLGLRIWMLRRKPSPEAHL